MLVDKRLYRLDLGAGVDRQRSFAGTATPTIFRIDSFEFLFHTWFRDHTRYLSSRAMRPSEWPAAYLEISSPTIVDCFVLTPNLPLIRQRRQSIVSQIYIRTGILAQHALKLIKDL